jgi:hypothetical protein
MPTPCTNCVRFHYGPCRQAPKQCYICGGINHIERYCPNQKHTIHYVQGEPLAGTAMWCEMHGLNGDPELKQRVLEALKTTPGSAIHINGVCIYRGYDKYFLSNDPPRGRTFEERVTHRGPRSLSSGRGRERSAFRSHPRDGGDKTPSPSRGSPGYRSPVYQTRYHSRSPLRQQSRTPSPYRQQQYRARSPRYATDSNAVVFEARDGFPESCQPENRRPRNRGPQPSERGRLTPVKFSFPPPQQAARSRLLPAFNAPPSSRTPLGQVSNNIPKTDQLAFNAPKPAPPLSRPRSDSMTIEVDDPYFILGVEKGASEAE